MEQEGLCKSAQPLTFTLCTEIMSVDQLAKLAGILGFFISLATFALTRWERRASISFGMDSGSSSDFVDEHENGQSTVNLTISNLGARPVLIDLRTLAISSKSNMLQAWSEDHWGVVQREVLLKPNDFQMLGIPLQTFEEKLKIEVHRKYDEKSIHFLRPLKVSVESTDGKIFTSKKLKYWEATGEFHRA